MPVRGFVIILAIALAVAAFWLYHSRSDRLNPNGGTVSRDITPAPGRVRPDGLPSFDIVRIDATGQAVMSGHARAGAKVTIRLNERPIGTGAANDRGEWVVVTDRPIKGASLITASARLPDGTEAMTEECVFVRVPDGRGTPLAVLEGIAGPSHILQRPDELGSASLALDLADYVAGELILTGRAAPRSQVRVYLDNEPYGTARADGTGAWVLKPHAVSLGAYTMRVDELASDGAVAARIELPFERADPDLAARQMLQEGTLGFETGVTQWRIARRLTEGFRLTVLYPSHQDQNRDPNLIYPGQVFEQGEALLQQ